MVFLVPSHFDSFVPAPSSPGQRVLGDSPTRPWNGDLVVTGLRPSDRTLSERIQVTAIETDGEKLESWPNEFALQIIYTDRDLRHHMSQWVAANQQPTCNFIPSRPRNADQRDMTVTTFRLLSKLLIESHTVAVASWRVSELSGSGVIIYPAPNSSAYLIGVVFHSSPFPDFIRSALSPTIDIPAAHPPYQPSSYSGHPQQMAQPSSYRHGHHISSSPHHSSPSSPIDQQPGSYRSIQPMPSRGHAQYSYPPPTGNYGQAYAAHNGTPL